MNELCGQRTRVVHPLLTFLTDKWQQPVTVGVLYYIVKDDGAAARFLVFIKDPGRPVGVIVLLAGGDHLTQKTLAVQVTLPGQPPSSKLEKSDSVSCLSFKLVIIIPGEILGMAIKCPSLNPQKYFLTDFHRGT